MGARIFPDGILSDDNGMFKKFGTNTWEFPQANYEYEDGYFMSTVRTRFYFDVADPANEVWTAFSTQPSKTIPTGRGEAYFTLSGYQYSLYSLGGADVVKFRNNSGSLEYFAENSATNLKGWISVI